MKCCGFGLGAAGFAIGAIFLVRTAVLLLDPVALNLRTGVVAGVSVGLGIGGAGLSVACFRAWRTELRALRSRKRRALDALKRN